MCIYIYILMRWRTCQTTQDRTWDFISYIYRCNAFAYIMRMQIYRIYIYTVFTCSYGNIIIHIYIYISYCGGAPARRPRTGPGNIYTYIHINMIIFVKQSIYRECRSMWTKTKIVYIHIYNLLRWHTCRTSWNRTLDDNHNMYKHIYVTYVFIYPGSKR